MSFLALIGFQEIIGVAIIGGGLAVVGLLLYVNVRGVAGRASRDDY